MSEACGVDTCQEVVGIIGAVRILRNQEFKKVVQKWYGSKPAELSMSISTCFGVFYDYNPATVVASNSFLKKE